MRKVFWGKTAVAAMMMAGGFQGALAQATDEDGIRVVEEIIVTARKTDERLEDVPAGISVLTGDDADLLALDGVADYIRQVPNAILINAGPEYLSDISIRGQGGGRQGFSESTTGIYRNGIYIAGGGFGGRSFNRLDFFDLKTIETYRGPQGALYGRNAVGGAVNVINNKPDDDLSFELKAGYDDVERHEVSGIANIPLGENAAARFGAFYIDQNDGFITDQNTGETVDQQEYFGVRGALRADFSPSTTATVTLEHYDSTAPGFSALGQRITPNTVALPAFLGGPQSGDLDPGPFEAIDSRVGEVEIEETSIFAELESDWGIGDLTAIFVYKQRDGNRFNEDLDSFLGFQGVDILGITTDLTVAQTEDFERFGGEIRLASKPESNRRWLIGADFQTFDDIVVTANDGTSGLGGLAALATREENFTEELTSFSAFGLIGFDLSERLDLTLEARLQNDSKDFVYTRDQSGAIVIDTGDLDDSWTRFLPAATLSYDMNDDQIVFLRAASGYRPGGFNTGVDTTSVDLIPYDPETAYSFEAGWKGTTDGGVRFGLNAFYVITDDVQAVSTLSTMDTTTALQNIGDTDIYGLEGEISGVVDAGSGRIRWGVSAATTQGSFADGAVITTSGGGNMVEVIDLSGARVNRTRDYVASANAFYFGPLTSSLDWFGGGSIQAEGGGFENASGDTSSATGRELEDFFLVDVRIGIRGETWTFSIFGKNLTDEVYRVQTVLGNAYYNEPQKFGAEFKLRFGG
ncbi:MAG TPA: hypothetical protein DCG72_00445 [Gammaproteobacteria bacterium]|jgi:iron complex outermembrane receptor protein|nr:hypothetical protein [Gammaproteobacteria bacterium]